MITGTNLVWTTNMGVLNFATCYFCGSLRSDVLQYLFKVEIRHSDVVTPSPERRNCDCFDDLKLIEYFLIYNTCMKLISNSLL